jgi:hypothetical protein
LALCAPQIEGGEEAIEGEGAFASQEMPAQCWISTYAPPPTGFIGMLSIQEGGPGGAAFAEKPRAVFCEAWSMRAQPCRSFPSS